MWMIRCPRCKHEAPMKEFDPSLSDECTCPKCEAFFEVAEPEDDETEDDD